MDKARRLKIIRILILVLLISLTIYLLIIRDRINDLGAYGYPGIFLISVAANATIIFPLPGVVVTSAMGAVFNPFWVAVAAGLGAAVGEFSGYLAGFSGRAVIENRQWHERLVKWMGKYGDITILVFSFIPNPLFDVAGMTAGALKMPWYRFLLWCAIGKILKMLLFAYTGATILDLIPFF
jgi:membrane protein YqaA with SNARE-associated domain